jgi:4-hydroxybutyrate dehydrogenase
VSAWRRPTSRSASSTARAAGASASTTAPISPWVADLNRKVGLPNSLVATGVPDDVLPDVATCAAHDAATVTNPRAATRDDYLQMHPTS